MASVTASTIRMQPTTEYSGHNPSRRLRLSLGYRLFLSLILSMGLLVTLLLVAAGQKFERLERALGSERNHAELQLLKEEWQRNPEYQPLSVAGQRIWLDDDPSVPAYLRNLEPGFDGVIEQGDHLYAVLVEQLDGHRIIIASESQHIEEAEEEIGRFLRASWIILMLTIAAISYLLVRHLIRPVARFANQIDQLAPSIRGINLHPEGSSPEVNRMTRAFNRYLGKMDEYVERQHAFAAMASHELRSPLTVIQTSAELIASLDNNPAIVEHSRKILRSSQNMDAMIRSLLAITRDYRPDKDFESIHLLSLAQELADQRKPQGQRQNVSVELEIPPDIEWTTHKELLQMVLGNLLDNAIRHSNHSTVQMVWKKNALCIRNQGDGIDEAMIENLFERGVSHGSRGGYGLGLYISKLIADKMGWQLRLRNVENGTEACLILPPVG